VSHAASASRQLLGRSHAGTLRTYPAIKTAIGYILLQWRRQDLEVGGGGQTWRARSASLYGGLG
jgi:hypothetical protein